NYGIPGLIMAHNDMKQAVRFRLNGTSNPLVEINKLVTTFERLNKIPGMGFTPAQEGLILLQAIPTQWDHLTTVILNTKKIEDISFNAVRMAIMQEWERKHSSSRCAHKMTGVKRKNNHPAQGNAQAGPSNRGNNNRGRGGYNNRGGRGNNRGRGGN